MNENKCPNCGKYLPNKTFYTLDRSIGYLKVWVCPFCGHRVSKWVMR